MQAPSTPIPPRIAAASAGLRLSSTSARCGVLVGAWLSSLVLAHAAAPAAAHAQDLCFPKPVALPGLSGAPDWQAPGTVRDELNEPRWAAAPQTSFESDLTANEGLLRILVDAAHTELSVSFQTPTDPDIVSNADAIYFGFTTDGVTGGLAKGVRINMPTTGSDPVAIDPAGVLVQGYEYDIATAGHWSSPAAAPAWLKEPVAFRSDPAAAWGINFKVDLAAAGVGTAAPLKMLFAMHKRDETALNSIDLSTPEPGAAPLFGGTLFIENPASWKTTSAIDAACVGGISLSGNQIGTRNASASKINTTDGAINHFFATPTYPVAPAFSGLIEGKFHIANWGSIAASDAAWTELPGGGAVPNGAPPAPNNETLEFACPANAGGQTCGLPTPAETHQCVYVALRAAPGQTVRFTKASAYRNMEFQALSDHSAPAEISVKGLAAVLGNDEPREIYLYVHAKNMSPHQDKPMWLQTDKMAATRRLAEAPPPVVRKTRQQMAASNEPGKPRELPLPNTGIRDLDLTAQQALSSVWPTYDVHVYYATGKTLRIGDKETKQLAPMYPFTYFYSHEGPLYGFSHALTGLDGAVVEELRPNVYRVQIPSEGSVKISTRATAHEEPKAVAAAPVVAECPACPPPPETSCNCSVPGSSRGVSGGWALLVALVIGVGVRVRRRRRA